MKKKTILLLGVLFSTFSYGQEEAQSGWITCTDFHVTRPLSELSKEFPFQAKERKNMETSSDRSHRTPQTFLFSAEDGLEYGNDPAFIQTEMGFRNPANKAPIKNWPGQTAAGFRPSDPSGAAGPNHYIQAINGTPFRVYDKNTGANLLTANIGSLWSPATPDDGDPIILYDRYADRWFVSQFGQSGNKIYIAISKTNDPTGQYYTYTFSSPQFPDYLKFGIWADGYYMTSNQGTQKIFVFERDAMIAGNSSARAVYKTYSPGATNGFYVPLPADADGGLPTVGTPCPFFAYNDNAWGGGAIDGVKIWDVAVTWGATPAATVTLKGTVPTAAFDASYDNGWDDIPQPGTSQKLDGIGGIPTYRAQWRKWSGYNSLVLNWGVKISASQRSIKWVELRQNQATGTWSLYQEGTYTPDVHSRWLGSIAMDDNGSIALCYAKSSSSVYPSLCYTGRLASDPLGQMTFAETVAQAGTSSETSGNRYGDYSQTALDPDGITFWHTGEYTSSGTKTRVYSFQLPTGSLAPTANFTASSTSPCVNSTVTFTDQSTASPTSWSWSFSPNTVSYQGGTSTSSQNPQVQFTNAGVYQVTLLASNSSGSDTEVKTSYINVTSNAVPSITISGGASAVCEGESITFNSTNSSGGSSPSYQWKLNGGNVGSNSSTFSSSSLNDGDQVSCVMTSNSTCVSTSTANSNVITVSVNPIPDVPVINVSGNTLTSNASNGNQWYLNGNVIFGATSQSYEATQNGNYTVTVNENGCVSEQSSPASISWGVESNNNPGTHFVLYPNPSQGIVNLVFTSTEIMPYVVMLYDVQGKLLFMEDIEDFSGTYINKFDLTKYGSGEYFISIINAKNEKIEKVILF
jgi:PKD repeat protein